MQRYFISFLFVFAIACAVGQNPPTEVLPFKVEATPVSPPAVPATVSVPQTEAQNPIIPQPAMQAPPSDPQAEVQPPAYLRPATGPLRTTPPPANTVIPPAAAELIRMQYPNSDVKEVLALYERLTQKKLVYDNQVQGTVTIVINAPVNRSEAIKIIEINLLLNGFSLVPATDPGIIKVMGISKNARNAGLPILSDLDQLPEGERVVTFVFELKYADPMEIQPILTQYSPPTLSTSILALPKSKLLLVTENISVIRGLAKIIAKMDIPPAEVVSEFIKLDRADAKDVLEKLEKIFEKKEMPGTAPVRAPVNPNPIAGVATPEGAAPSIEIQGRMLSEDSIILGKIKLTADIRTNRIHVITRPANLPFVHKLIQEFDSNIPFGEPHKRPLKYVSASDMLEILVKAITEPGMKSEEIGGNGQKSAPAQNKQNASNNSMSGGSGGSGGGTINTAEELTTQAVDTTPKAVTVGSTKIIADPRENTIIVLGNKEVEQKILKLLDEIDVRAPQVTLNTVIGELTIKDDKKLGVDYLLHPNNLTISGTSGVAAVAATRWALTQFTGAGLITGAASSLGAAGTGVTGVISPTSNLDIVVNALESTGRFHVTNRPMIVARNNEKAIVLSGEDIPVPGNTQSTVTTGNNTALNATVEYKSVALKLEVVPLINSDREVSLDIVQTLNSPSGQTTNIGGSTVPTFTTRYIKTKVSVPDRCTVVLGGLIKKTTGEGGDGIPLISKIPVLGYLFKNTTKNNEREELIVMIRPEVTVSPVEQIKNSQDEQRRLMVEPNVEATLKTPTPTSKAIKFRN